MTIAQRLKPNATLHNGQRVRVLGDPFKIWETGLMWVAALCGDGKVRPAYAATTRLDS